MDDETRIREMRDALMAAGYPVDGPEERSLLGWTWTCGAVKLEQGIGPSGAGDSPLEALDDVYQQVFGPADYRPRSSISIRRPLDL